MIYKPQFTISSKLFKLIFLYMLCILLFLIYSYSETFNNLIGIGVLVLSLILIWLYRNSMVLFLMGIFIGYCNYSVVVGIYLSPDLRPVYLYPQIIDIEVYGIGISLLFLFMLSMVCLAPVIENNLKNNFSKQFVRNENRNQILFFLALALFLLIIFLGYQSFEDSKGESSPIYEYGTILVILMFYYCGNNKTLKFLATLSSIIYVLTSIMNGTRVEALVCLFILILCFARKNISKLNIFIGMIIGIVIFSSIGIIRGNWNYAQGDLTIIASKIFESKFVFDTCTYAYFPMLCMIEQFKQYIFESGFYYLVRFLMTIIVGVSRITDGDLIKISRESYFHNYGGISLGFFYVWFSYLGSLVFAIAINQYIKLTSLVSSKITDIKLCAVLYAVATVPRWYLYGPWPLFRGVIICLLGFVIFKLANKIIMLNKAII